jgi:formylglycine-generating enzyme required for sulfatase activity
LADVFISYKSERRLAAEYLAHIITDHGFTVWWDYGLLVGEDFRDRIDREIRAARAVVVLWCPMSVQSRWVKDEAYLAQELGKIVPAKVSEVPLPLGFNGLDTLNLAAWDGSPRGDGLARLIRAVEVRTGKTTQRNEDQLGRLQSAWLIAGRKRLVDFPLIETGVVEPPPRDHAPQPQPEHQRRPEPRPPPPIPPGVAIPMVDVPPGRYWRGLDPNLIDRVVDQMRVQQLNIDFNSVRDVLSGEARQEVQLPAFRISRTPVTNRQFAEFVDKTGYRTTAEHNGEETTWRRHRAERPEHPVVHVSAHDAEAFCKWVGLSLPTVDQWRRAYRGDDRRIYPWGDQFDASRCNTAESCKGMQTTPVGQFAEGSSPFGCFDMVGNVEEWTLSLLNEDRVILGGSWCMSCELYGIPVTRRHAPPSFRSADLGFRCVGHTA